MKFLCLVIIFFLSLDCFSITRGMTFSQMLKHSDYVGVVHIEKKASIEGCGVEVIVKPQVTYKGNENTFKLLVLNESDLLIDTQSYFLAATKKILDHNCGHIQFAVGDNIQTIFPFWGTKSEYILSNRQSFLTLLDGVSYDFTDIVKKINVIEQRIYAVAEWRQIKKMLDN